jgi:hypothetical protein
LNPPIFIIGGIPLEVEDELTTLLVIPVLETPGILNPPIFIIGGIFLTVVDEVDLMVLVIDEDTPPQPFPVHLAV